MTDAAVRLGAALADRYRIDREIGAGGMATVYLAEDLRHHRRVALKVLRPELGAVLGPERFLSEINVTANLQHPHLLPLFDSGEVDGLLFYVMPYVEGESLRARLDRERQLPVEDAVRLAGAVASALDYAHRHGVIHRDLKPENILLHDGQPLVADFGIALAVSNAGGGRVTQTGLSLGTPQYMSPEQATGDRVIDARSDIYSLGAVLYEMLTGEAPHSGTTSQAIIARLLTEKPRSVRATRASVPAHVEAAVERALEKLPADRFATAHEFMDVLAGRTVLTTAAPAGTAALPATAGWRSVLRQPLTLGALLLAVVGWSAMAALARPALTGRGATGAPTIRFEQSVVQGNDRLSTSVTYPFALSPDGRTAAFRFGAPGGTERLYLRRSDELAPRLLHGPEAVGSFTFSPDGRHIAFGMGESVYRIGIDGGASTRVGDVPRLAGMTWAGDLIIVGRNVGTMQVLTAAGGTPESLVVLDSAARETSQRRPVVLADGETILYTSTTGTGPRVGIASLRTRRSAVLDVAGVSPLGMIDDLLIYHDGRSAIMGVPFDRRKWQTTGAPIALVDSVSAIVGSARAALSPAGTLIYLHADGTATSELVELNLGGGTESVLPHQRRFVSPRYAPDGRRILVALSTDTLTELWVHDRRADTFTPVVRSQGADRGEWSPDGRDLLFVSNRRGAFELWRQPADGTAPAALVQPAGPPGQPVQGIFTPDARHLVYRTGYNGDDVWYRAWSGDTTSHPLAADPTFIERNTSISPDGRWAAYASNESGTYQVYVRPFPGPGPRLPVTVNGGDTPVWSPDGRRIHYVNGNRFEEATVTFAPEYTVARRTLFDHDAVMHDWLRNWDLSPDGSRLLVVRASGQTASQPRIVTVYNWAAEVRARRGTR
jgi:eukaryotic-like serine/threonine-protein kinase